MLPSFQDRRWPDSPPKKVVRQLWWLNGLKPGSLALYERVLGIFFAYCAELGLLPISQLSAAGCDRFWRSHVQRSVRCRDPKALRQTLDHPLRAYAWALTATGHAVPSWTPESAGPARPSIITAYLRHAREHRGLAESGLTRDAAAFERFLAHLKRRRRDWREVRLLDLDDFLLGLTQRLAPATVGRVAYVLRSCPRGPF